MKWVIIKGVRYPNSVISAFAAYNMDNPFLKVRIRNKYHIVPFDDVNKMASQMVYLMNNYPDFVQIGRWWISKKTVIEYVECQIVWKDTGDDQRTTIKLSLSINDDDNDNVFYHCNGIESLKSLVEYGVGEFIVIYCWSFFSIDNL